MKLYSERTNCIFCKSDNLHDLFLNQHLFQIQIIVPLIILTEYFQQFQILLNFMVIHI